MISKPRTLREALTNAERIREELPKLIQPEQTSYDIVTLADAIYEMAIEMAELRGNQQ